MDLLDWSVSTYESQLMDLNLLLEILNWLHRGSIFYGHDLP